MLSEIPFLLVLRTRYFLLPFPAPPHCILIVCQLKEDDYNPQVYFTFCGTSGKVLILVLEDLV